MLRIERSVNDRVVFTLSGRIQTADVEQFRQLLALEPPGRQLIFILQHVTLINQEGVAFLAGCERKGIKIESCPPYIRNWIDLEKCRNRRCPEEDSA